MDFVIIGSQKGMKWDGCESSYQDQVVNIFLWKFHWNDWEQYDVP